jgi:hypothetical protein
MKRRKHFARRKENHRAEASDPADMRLVDLAVEVAVDAEGNRGNGEEAGGECASVLENRYQVILSRSEMI